MSGTNLQNIGIMGGTFDPIHYGHLILAEQAREQLGLDRVSFVTAARPPHKAASDISGAADRLQMVKLALADNPEFEPCDIELKLPGPSYTVRTLEILTKQNPGARFYFLLGSDEVAAFGTWREPERIVKLAQVISAARPGFAEDEALRALPAHLADAIKQLSVPGVDISSSDIRHRVREGRTIRYLVPPDVADYIAVRSLYRGL